MTKSLIPSDTPELKAIVRLMGVISNVYRFHTGPWDEAYRIISGVKFAELRETIDQLTLELDQEKENLRKAMPRILADAPRKLGTMFDASQYPSIDEIIDAYSVTFETEVIPDRSKNIMIGLDNDRVEKLIDDANAKDVRRTQELAEHTHGVVASALSGMIESLNSYGVEIEDSKRTKTFRDTMVTNIADIADVIKGLNITGDAAQDALADTIKAKLTSVSAAVLRGDKVKGDNRTPEMIEKDAADMRKTISADAKVLFDDLDGIYGIAS